MIKSHKLPLSTQRAIGKFKEKYPTATIGEVADRYKCTYNQARYAILRYQRGELTRERGKTKDVKDIIENSTPEELFRRQYEKALAQLEADVKLPAAERIVMLDKLAGINKTLQQVSLQNHLKRADAEVIARIVRRYEPEADESRIIAVYREELEKWKNSL